jgi:hypothetical protein
MSNQSGKPLESTITPGNILFYQLSVLSSLDGLECSVNWHLLNSIMAVWWGIRVAVLCNQLCLQWQPNDFQLHVNTVAKDILNIYNACIFYVDNWMCTEIMTIWILFINIQTFYKEHCYQVTNPSSMWFLRRF